MSEKRGSDWKEWSQHVLIEIKRLNDEQRGMNVTLIENTEQLKVHIEGVKLARQEIADLRKLADGRFKPLEEHQIKVSAYWKVLTMVACAPAGIYYLCKIVTEFLHR